jgi:hypothetical protein
MLSDAEKFCRSFPWEMEWFWFGTTALLELDDGKRVAKLELSDKCVDGSMPTSGTYNGFVLSIINKQSGKIDQKAFAFRDYLRERCDNRPDYDNRGWFGVMAGSGWDWYIARPKNPGLFTRAIERYVDFFA